MQIVLDINVKRQRNTETVSEDDEISLISKGRVIKTAAIFDQYWLERDVLPEPQSVIAKLREMKNGPDIFTFAQKVPEENPKYDYYMEWDNVAVLSVSNYDDWFKSQISSNTKRNIRASKKRGVVVRVAEYDEAYVQGIMSIYNESPIRHRKKFPHYNKDFETVKKENGTYAERSTYLAAYYESEMIGYLKIVWDKDVGAIMQILSKMEFFDKRPNNALLSEAVQQCDLRGGGYLLYEKFNYGKKGIDSLAKYKQNNGFGKMDLPRYYVPLTIKGSMALRMGLHKSIMERIPEGLISPVREMRDKWYTSGA